MRHLKTFNASVIPNYERSKGLNIFCSKTFDADRYFNLHVDELWHWWTLGDYFWFVIIIIIIIIIIIVEV